MASKRRITDWAEELPERFLQCRDFGHSWRPWAVRFDREFNSYERSLRCSRCRSERHESLGMSGAKSSRGYTYPEGYQAPPGTGHLVLADRDELRIASIQRLITSPELLTRGAAMEREKAKKKAKKSNG